jgi:hypothetical protein
MSNQSYFVISLDFELMWGMFDKVNTDTYGANIAGVHSALPKILTIFADNDIHATWATVGMLMAKNKTELMSTLPPVEQRPKYPEQKVSSYYHIENSSIGEDAAVDPYHFGAPLVEKIIATQNQELASHTFSHYYCIDGRENGVTIFAADCQAFTSIAKRFNKNISSIVFPRNQTTPEALKILEQVGLSTYRGTPNHFLYSAKNDVQQSNPLLRIWRLKDAYLNLSGHHTFKLNQTIEGGLVNVRASRFLRPYSKTLSFLEPLRLRRIKKSMTHAAQSGEIFHLWWHPHNFGINQNENLNFLKAIIDHYHFLQKEYGMQSATMGEIATIAKSAHESTV